MHTVSISSLQKTLHYLLFCSLEVLCWSFMSTELTLFGSVEAKAKRSPMSVICTTALPMMPLTKIPAKQLQRSFELKQGHSYYAHSVF